MSHVATVDVEIKDLDALEAAGKRIGMELVRGQKTFRWYGTHVGDYPLPPGFTEEDLGTCEHALRVVGRADSYEVGVVRRRDGRPGWSLMWDFYAGGYGLMEKVGENCQTLRREYACVVASRTAQKQGFRVHEVRRQDGSVQLRLSR